MFPIAESTTCAVGSTTGFPTPMPKAHSLTYRPDTFLTSCSTLRRRKGAFTLPASTRAFGPASLKGHWKVQKEWFRRF